MSFLVIDKKCMGKIYSNSGDLDIEFLEFETKEEAEHYINYGKIISKKNDEIIVFTDGACSNNGKTTAIAGIGVYFEENDKRNVSKRIKGKQSNNTAELSAVIEVFTVLKNEIKEGGDVTIYTDSEYVIKCCTSYGEKCEKNNWGASKRGRKIPNAELVKQVYTLYKQSDNVNIVWVKAHTNKDDTLSKGNEGADRLANLSIEDSNIDKIINNPPHLGDDTKNYINVPFENKDFAKECGAKWDVHKKKWYYGNNLSNDNIDILKGKFT